MTSINIVPRMLTIKEISAETDISYHTIRQWCLEGKISYVKAGNKYLINWDKFIDFLNAGEPDRDWPEAV